MLQVTEQELFSALEEANPWWQPGRMPPYADLPARAYLPDFLTLIQRLDVRRATLLLGQRRIGKTVLVHHAISELLISGVSGAQIFFCSTEAPVFGGVPLARLIELFERRFVREPGGTLYVFLDEIQYIKDWELHLKVLVDSRPGIRFIATGSAAAALRHKSFESGAGRFTEFYLPPLTFAEFLDFSGRRNSLVNDQGKPQDIVGLNRAFVDWLNYGGFPEAVFSASVRERPTRFIKQDILDKVLLRDLPSLYGVGDVQELHRFFALLAYNTGQEMNLEELAQSTGINKATLNKYLTYLEAAFLIRRLHRVDQDARHFKRATAFKVYLTNPSLRTALYAHLEADSPQMGAMVETGVALHLHRSPDITTTWHYARWKKGEVDFVALTPDQLKVAAALEVKWSDRAADSLNDLKPLAEFTRNKPPQLSPILTTRTAYGEREAYGQRIGCIPTAVFCLMMGDLELELLKPDSPIRKVMAETADKTI